MEGRQKWEYDKYKRLRYDYDETGYYDAAVN
jgi:hypothetical protein